MLESLRDRAASASKWTRWFWLLAGVLVVVLVGAALLLRRRSILTRISQLRLELSKKNQALLDAKSAADVTRHTDAIDRRNARAAEIQGEIAVIEAQIEEAEEEHTAVLGEINRASGWSDLEALRQKGNDR